MNGLLSSGIDSFFNTLLIISALFIGICIFLFIYFLGRHIKRDDIKVDERKKRLRKSVKVAEDVENTEKKRNFSVLLGQIEKLSFTEKLGGILVDADILIKPEEFLLICFFAGVVLPILLLLLFQNVALFLLVIIAAGIIPVWYVKSRKSKKIQMFDDQLADALLMMSNSLVAGLSFQQAMENIAREMPAPISGEFGRVVKEMRFGKTLDSALNGMMERIKSDDLMIALNAIMIQHQVGGNLSEILETIAETVKDRRQIKKDIKVITAQGRFSGIIISLLPAAICLVISVINPTYMIPLFTTPLGMVMIGVAIVMEICGIVLIRKIINIEY